MTCVDCGAAVPSDFKFCPHCGRAIEAKTLPETEQTCPMCKKDNQATSVLGMVQSQVTQVGYGDNSRLVMSKLAESLIEAVGSKPGFLERPLASSAMPRYEKYTARFANSYYCTRCSVIFFTENGTKHHSPVNAFYRLLRYDEQT